MSFIITYLRRSNLIAHCAIIAGILLVLIGTVAIEFSILTVIGSLQQADKSGFFSYYLLLLLAETRFYLDTFMENNSGYPTCIFMFVWEKYIVLYNFERQFSTNHFG